jgi:hypothetical protein
MRLKELIEKLTELKDVEGNLDVFVKNKGNDLPLYFDVKIDKIVDDIEDNIYWSESDTGEKVITIDVIC